MKIVLKEGLEINDPMSNKLSLDYFKKLVNNELKKVDKINSLINEELTDEEYMNKMLSIYELKFGDFGGVKDSNMIYTQIPYYSEVDEKQANLNLLCESLAKAGFSKTASSDSASFGLDHLVSKPVSAPNATPFSVLPHRR